MEMERGVKLIIERECVGKIMCLGIINEKK
jgi:hypothetical protein